MFPRSLLSSYTHGPQLYFICDRTIDNRTTSSPDRERVCEKVHRDDAMIRGSRQISRCLRVARRFMRNVNVVTSQEKLYGLTYGLYLT